MVLAQAAGIGTLGTIVSVLSGVVSVVLVGVTWYVRRQGKEAKESRQLKDTNIAALRWHYRVSTLAAVRGWDADPAWPETPRELTLEYLLGQAEQDPASNLVQLAEAAKDLRKGPA
jgi:hypothetical protein